MGVAAAVAIIELGAAIVGGFGLAYTLGSFALIKRLPISALTAKFLYGATGVTAACFALIFAFFTILCMRNDRTAPWLEQLSTIACNILAVPVIIAALFFFVIGIKVKAGWALKSYYIFLGVFSILVLAFPATLYLAALAERYFGG